MGITKKLHLGALQTGVLRSITAFDPWLEKISQHPAPCLWLLPELVFGGFEYEHKDRWCEETPAVLQQLHTFATSSGHTLAGTFWEKTDRSHLNSFYFFEPDRDGPRKLYSKMHLFPLSKEEKHFVPGAALHEPLQWNGLRIGFAICFDLRFPELFRYQQDGSISLFLVPAQWPLARRAHWQKLLQARAIENQTYVLGVNGCGPSSLGDLGGCSALISPWGEELFSMGSSPGLEVRPLEPRELQRARRPFQTMRSNFFNVSRSS